MDLLAQGVVASLVAGLATGFGGLPVLLGRRVPHRVLDAVLGFAAGVMFALSAGALLVHLDLRDPSVIVATLFGGGLVLALRAIAAVERAAGGARLDRGVRVALIVTLHNLVEGMAVVAAFGHSGSSVGMGVALAIAAHNVPEGLAVAEPLRRAGVAPWRCVALAVASGLGEPLGAVLTLAVLGPVLPLGLASGLAGGAMVLLASTELVPEAFSHSYVVEAAAGLLAGILVALVLVGAPS